MTDRGSPSTSHVTNHLTDDIFHWCSTSDADWDPQIFFCKYSRGCLKEPLPDEVICLRHCWDCVHKYHQERQTFVELNQEQTEWVLFSFECIVLGLSLEDVKQDLAKMGRSKNKAKKSSHDPNFIDLTRHLPIVLQEMLKYPFFFFMKDIHDLFIEVLDELFTLYGKDQSVPQFPGIYLLLIHPKDQVRNWAEQKVMEFDPIQLADSSDLLQVVNIVFSVLKFGIQDDPSVCDDVTMDEPSRRVIISSYQFNMDVYWQGLHNLLNHMDSELVHNINIKEEIPQTILNSVLQTAKSDDHEKSFFLLKLSCFVVLLKSSKEAFWLKVQNPQDYVFISIINCQVWKALLEEISRKSTANLADLCKHFTWVLHWAKSLNGRQEACATDMDYSITYLYHVHCYIQHRFYHNLPTSPPRSMCEGQKKCLFLEMKKSQTNKPIANDLPQQIILQKEAQQVFNHITKQLYGWRKRLSKPFSSKIMQPELAGFLPYKGIKRLVLALYQQKSPKAKIWDEHEDESGSESDTDGWQEFHSDESERLNSSQRTPDHFPRENKITSHHIKQPKVVLKRKPITKSNSPYSSEAARYASRDKDTPKSKSHFKFKSKVHSKASESMSLLEESREEKIKQVSPEEARSSALFVSVKLKDIRKSPQVGKEDDDTTIKKGTTATSSKSEEIKGTRESPAKTKGGPTIQPSAEGTFNGPWRKLTEETISNHSPTRILLDEQARQPTKSTSSQTPKMRRCFVRLSRISDPFMRTQKRTLAWDSDSDSDIASFKKRSRRLPSDDESSCDLNTAVDSGKGSSKNNSQEKGKNTSDDNLDSRLQYSTQSDSDWDPPNVFKDDVSLESRKKAGDKKGGPMSGRGEKPMSGRGESPVSRRERGSDSERVEDAEVILISSSDDDEDVDVRTKRRVKSKNSVIILSDGEDDEEGDSDVNQGSYKRVSEGHLGPPVVIKDIETKEEKITFVKKEEDEEMEIGKDVERKDFKEVENKLEENYKSMDYKENKMEVERDNKGMDDMEEKMNIGKKRKDYQEGKMKRGDDTERLECKGTKKKGKCDTSNCKACQGMGGKHMIQNIGKEDSERKDEEKDDGYETERLATSMRTSPGLADQSGEEHSGTDKNLRDDKSEKDGNVIFNSEDGNVGKKGEKDDDGKKNNFLTKYICFNEEESCMDSDAETDDGSTTDSKEEGLSSPVFDFQEDLIDQLEDEPTFSQLDRMKRDVKVEEDGNISDGLDLDEIIDITETMTESEIIEDEDEKVTQDKEGRPISLVDLWNESSSDVPLVISESPVKIEPLTEEDVRGRCDKGEALVDRHALDMVETIRVEKAKTKSKERVEEKATPDNILLGYLEGGSTEEEEGDEDDGWVDEDSSWRVGDDGWMDDDNEEELEVKEDGEIEEDDLMDSEGFQVSITNPDTTSLVQRVPTGVTEVKGGPSPKSKVSEGKGKKERIANQTKNIGQAPKQLKKDSVQTKDGFRSKSFYRHHLPNKLPARRKNQLKRNPINYAEVRKKMDQKRLLDAAVPLGKKSLVTGQSVRGGKEDQELGEPQVRLGNESTTPTNENKEIRLAPPIKSSAYRSKRSESLLESLKQAETQNKSKPRRASSKGLSTSMSQIGTKIGENSSALSQSFTAGVTNKEHQRDKADTSKNGDLLSSIMDATTHTFQEMNLKKLKKSYSIPQDKSSSSVLEKRPEMRSGEPLKTKDNPSKPTVSKSAMKSGQNLSSQNSAKNDPRSNQGKKVHFADTLSFAPAHSTNLPKKMSVPTNSHKQSIHPRPIISYDKVTIETSSGGGHRVFSRSLSAPAKTSEFSPSTDKQPTQFESSERKAPKLCPTKPLTRDQFIGWILGWKVGHMEDKIDVEKILKACDYFNTLKEVPNAFISVDEFYKTFIPLKMIQIWEKLQRIYAEIGNARTSVAVLTESMPFKLEEQPYKFCKFKVTLPQTSGKSNPSSVSHPQTLDLVIIRPESSYSFVPVFGYVDNVAAFKSAGFYSSNKSQELVLSIRVLGDVDFKTHCVKLQVMTSLNMYLNQLKAFISLEKSTLSSNILCPTRRDVFGEGQSSPVVENILKEILKRRQHNHRPSQQRPEGVTSEQEKFIKTAFHCIQQSYGIPRISMLQGPPGSGKSYTLIRLVMCLLKHLSKESAIPQSSIPQAAKPKILLCAPSDTAVDVLTGLLWKMIRHFKEEGSRHNTPEALPYFILRLGDAVRVNKKYKRFVMDEIVYSIIAKKENTQKELKTRIGKLQMQEQSIEATIQHRKFLIKKSGQIEKLQKDKMKFREERRKVEATLSKEQREMLSPEQLKQNTLNKADVILCKLSDICNPDLQELLRLPPTHPCVLRFSCAIIDEACQGLEVDTLLPLYSGITKLVLAGDPHELKPESFKLIPSKFKLTQSLFTRLWMNFQGSACQPVATLTEQHSCHPEIYSFPNKTFYNRRIQNRRKENLNTATPFMPYLVFNVTDGKQKASETGGWSNEAELDLIQCIVGIISKQKLEGIGLAIISPYPEQNKQIKARLNTQTGYVGDIDGLQGRTKDIVIISCVRTEVMSSKDSSFLHNHSKLNVALTRGSYSVFVIGNFTVLPKINGLWNNLIKDASQRDLYVDIVRKDFIKKLAWTCLEKEYQNFREKRLHRKQIANSQG